jgi:hypothetical protein
MSGSVLICKDPFPDPDLFKSSNPNLVPYIMIADLKHAFLAASEAFFSMFITLLKIQNF